MELGAYENGEAGNVKSDKQEEQETKSDTGNVAVVGNKSCSSALMEKYSNFLNRFYWLVMLIIFLLIVLCAALAAFLRDLPSFEDPIKGFEPRGTVIKDRTLSYVNLQRDPAVQTWWNQFIHPCYDTYSNGEDNYNASISKIRRRRDTTFQCSIEFNDCAGVVFTHVIDDENLLTPATIKTLCSIEITGSSRSYKLLSIGDYIGQFLNKSCSSLDEESILEALRQLELCAPYYYQTESGQDRSCLHPYSSCKGIPESCRADNIIFIILHMMVDKEFMPPKNLDKKILKTTMAFIDLRNYIYEEEDELEFVYKNYFQKSSRTFNNVRAVGLKFGIKFKLFSEYLLLDTIYLAMAAAFVIILIVIYTRSPLISFIAFLNMIFSLALAYFIYKIIFNLNFFPFLNVSTALLLVAIGADDTFIFCDLWEEASKLYTGSPRNVILTETMKHATVTMLVTSLTTASAFYASSFSPIIAIRCFGVYAGTAIMVNFILTISWLPAAMILNEILKCNFCSLSKLCPNLLEKISTHFLPNVIIKLRFIWMVFFTCLAIAGCIVIFFIPGLQKPTSSEFQVFKSGDILEQYDNVYKQKFRFSESAVVIPGAVLFGVPAVDNGNKWDPDDTGIIQYQSDFDISSEASQIWLQQFCRKLKFVYPVGLWIQGCLIDDYINFMQQPCQCNYTVCCNRSDFPFSSKEFLSCLPEFTFNHGNYGLYLDRYDQVKGLEMRFYTNQTFSMEHAVMDAFWKETEKWMNENLVNVPKALGNPWFIPPFTVEPEDYHDYLGFYDLQDSLASSTPISIIVSIAVASVVLFITQRNILIAVYSMLSLSGTIFSTIASLVLLGWELNILESVIFSITVGLSVDFTIHYGVAYLLSKDPDRKSRMRYSIKTMALAILFAAFSTFSVGAFMMGATVLVYRQLGTFLMIVMAISWMFSTLFFQSLCYLFGPQGLKCQLQCKKILCK